MTLLIRDGQGAWREPVGHGYDNEAALQAILTEHPSLVPGVAGEAIACREFESSVGPADVVILDAEGAITVVECKLRANAEVRRTIVGQVLDYASRLWQMDVEQFEQRWIRADAGRSPFDRLHDDDSELRSRVAANLAAARFNLVLAVDALNDDLRRVVEYLNAITKPTTGVMLVEFTRHHEESLEILIPRSFGAELVDAKVDAEARMRPRWTVAQYTEWCSEHHQASLPAVEAVLDGFSEQGFEIVGGRAETPSLNAAFPRDTGERVWILNLYTDRARGPLVEVRFNAFGDTEEAAHFASAVCAVPGVTITAKQLEELHFRRRPNMPLAGFTPESARLLVRTISSALASHDA
ncbi:hypothetical protein PCC79_17110 [Propioniciclava soli]|uniref:DUF91 domain-containing protein n=1 Tax=Propioniciclava soli TaxID=2775081 RepID=A0ABZ3C8P3_9ACTN